MRLARSVLLCLAFIANVTACAATLAGEVVALSDGDTITVLDPDRSRHKVRLAGIDGPESKQPFGRASKQHIAKLVFSKHVSVDWHKLERYGRIVGKVYQGDLDVGREKVIAGLAW